MMDDGPSVGEQSPHFNLETLDNRRIDIGKPSEQGELLFSSPQTAQSARSSSLFCVQFKKRKDTGSRSS